MKQNPPSDDALDVIRLRDVAGDGEDACLVDVQRFGGLSEPLGASGAKGDVSAFLGELLGHAAPIPSLAPVTRTTLPASPRSMSPTVRGTASTSREGFEERFGRSYVRRLEPLGEPAVDRGEQVPRFAALALLAPQSRQTRRGPELERLRPRHGPESVPSGLSIH